MNEGTVAVDPAKNSEWDIAREQLDSAGKRLENTLDRLKARLAPVLRPLPQPEAIDPANSPISPPGQEPSDLVQWTRARAALINRMASDVTIMMEEQLDL